MTTAYLIGEAINVLADQVPITPKAPPGSEKLINIVNYLSWIVMLAGIAALIYAGYFYAEESWLINEHSNVTSDGPPM